MLAGPPGSMSTPMVSYRGDFLAGDLYEEWAALTRRSSRLAHLDALSNLSNLHFSAGRYVACARSAIGSPNAIPAGKNAHRRLMRCYSRQGQPHLALMQYRVCAEALAEELGRGRRPGHRQLARPDSQATRPFEFVPSRSWASQRAGPGLQTGPAMTWALNPGGADVKRPDHVD